MQRGPHTIILLKCSGSPYLSRLSWETVSTTPRFLTFIPNLLFSLLFCKDARALEVYESTGRQVLSINVNRSDGISQASETQRRSSFAKTHLLKAHMGIFGKDV